MMYLNENSGLATSPFGLSFRLMIYLLLLVTASIYVRSIFGEFISLDDHHLIRRLTRSPDVDFYQLFFGERKGGVYYRPLLMGSHYVEKLLGAIDPMLMRLNNVFLQLANTLWVFLIILKIYILKSRNPGWWPLLWALLFGLHPLATESTNWISGRTDLLAGFFVLAATWLALHYRHRTSPIALAGAFFCAFCAMLSKEVAVAFVPGLLLLIWSPERSDGSISVGARALRLASVGLCLGLTILGFVFLRSFLIASNSSSIGRTLTIFFGDLTYSAMLLFRLLGFYVKKIAFPWPLSLAIIEVDPLYDLLGFALFCLLIWFLVRSRFSTDFFIISALLLSPAYLISFNQVAWTPYAERYAYIPVAFVFLGLASLGADRLRTLSARGLTAASLLILLSLFAPTTYARNGVWQTSLSLWADTVEKSPLCVEAHSSYAAELFKIGDFEKAEQHFELARSGTGYAYSPANDIKYAKFLFSVGRRGEAVAVLREVMTRTKGKSEKALSALVTLCSRSPYMVETCGGHAVVDADFEQLYNLTSDPVWQDKRTAFHAAGRQNSSIPR